MGPSRRIALIFPYDLGYCRGILRGIRAYARQKPQWLFTPLDPEADATRTARALRELGPAGIIAHVYRKPLVRPLQQAACPVVNVAGILDALPFPRVGLDNHAIGRLAAEHLLSAGFRHFAFAGHGDQAYSRERQDGYEQRLATAGHGAQQYQLAHRQFDPHGRPWATDRALGRWLASLPRPIAIFACNDLLGSQLTEACRQAGRRVPEDVAIVGVDNDDLMCEFSRPSLSSVQVPAEAVGQRAAELLDRLITSPGPTASTAAPLLLPPVRLVVRQSSDIVAAEDELVASAMGWIRQHVQQRSSVKHLLADLAVSRRLLERRFRAQLGRGIWEEMRRQRVELACGMLAGTTMPIGRIALACGFTDARHLSVTFRQTVGTTPIAYRSASSGAARPL